MLYDKYFIDEFKVRTKLVRNISFVFFFFAGVLVAQELPKAVLIDEHGNLPCDDSLGRLDNYYSELQQDPNSSGLVVISNLPSDRRMSVFRQAMIEAYSRFRQIDSERIKILRANAEGPMNIRFWRIPAGAPEPNIQAVDMSYLIPKDIKPFLFGWEYPFGDPICPEIDDRRLLARFLRDNPSARSNIVVKGRSRLSANRMAERIVNNLVKQYGISRHRVRVFTANQKLLLGGDSRIVEYWFLP